MDSYELLDDCMSRLDKVQDQLNTLNKYDVTERQEDLMSHLSISLNATRQLVRALRETHRM
jgi:hypothetical protein